MVVSSAYYEEAFVAALSAAFQAHQPLEHSTGARILSKAYPLAVLPDFLAPAFAAQLAASVAALPFRHRATDLYDFYQSPDLKPFLEAEGENPLKSACREIFSERFVGTVARIVGRPLGTQVDFAAQQYLQGQYLLCHDDRLEDRRVAFVLYLVDPAYAGGARHGGDFQKFPIDHRGAPACDPAESFAPRWNTLVFFEVSTWSHHQVAEVLGPLPRLSVSGWLHDRRPAAPPPALLPPPSTLVSPPWGPLAFAGPYARAVTATSVSLQAPLPVSAALLQMIDAARLSRQLYGDCRLDYPTWPVALHLHSGMRVDQPVRLEDGARRILLVWNCDADHEALVNGQRVPGGQLLVQHADRLRLCCQPDRPTTLVYWTFQIA